MRSVNAYIELRKEEVEYLIDILSRSVTLYRTSFEAGLKNLLVLVNNADDGDIPLAEVVTQSVGKIIGGNFIKYRPDIGDAYLGRQLVYLLRNLQGVDRRLNDNEHAVDTGLDTPAKMFYPRFKVDDGDLIRFESELLQKRPANDTHGTGTALKGY